MSHLWLVPDDLPEAINEVVINQKGNLGQEMHLDLVVMDQEGHLSQEIHLDQGVMDQEDNLSQEMHRMVYTGDNGKFHNQWCKNVGFMAF